MTKVISDGLSSIYINKNGKVELIVGDVKDYDSYYKHTIYQCDDKIIKKLMKMPNNINDVEVMYKLISMLNTKCEIQESYHYDPEDEDEEIIEDEDDPWEWWEEYCDDPDNWDDPWCDEE